MGGMMNGAQGGSARPTQEWHILESRWFWIIVIGTSVAIRLYAAGLFSGRVPGGDAPIYTAIAQNILSGEGMFYFDPATGLNIRATYPPLYPFLLSAVGSVFPLGMPTYFTLNLLLDSAAAAGLAAIGRTSGHRSAGLLAAALFMLWPIHLAITPMARKETLLELLVVVQALSVLKIRERAGLKWMAMFGSSAGLLALAQPALALLPVLFGIAILPRMGDVRRWAAAMAVGIACAGLVLLPWWIRNWLLFDRFVPLTNGGGISLWTGSTPTGNGTWIEPPSRFYVGDEFAIDAAMRAEANATIRAAPWDYLVHCLQKWVRGTLLDFRGTAHIYWARPRAHEQLMHMWGLIATTFHVLALVAAALTSWFCRRELVTHLSLACIAQTLIFGMWFEYDDRHRYFLTPLLVFVAALGIVVWFSRERAARQYRDASLEPAVRSGR